ncbi:phage holin family protein [Erythrobacter rubeus]|uniref:Phage holin family protein n=1 Tax=Erythrobacter rubeus TaxID=2760803 RepID=A0ABR8KR73_9SPHN|nr:phage holin family protein [Erythrobacter rubeus]MBD2841912.1 phage holin family protein [Erythrobacter rubeus]
MRDDERPSDEEHGALDPVDSETAEADPSSDEDAEYEESLTDELSALIDDGRTYAEAEIGFQKTRAKLAGASVGKAVALLVVAAITLHIAVLALAVGLVIALEPLVTIWGAIAIVVGVLLLVTGWLALKAKRNADRLGLMFGSSQKGDGE